ncbi:hypothetical protein VYU27_005764 [Nannochloropsis oceanica]
MPSTSTSISSAVHASGDGASCPCPSSSSGLPFPALTLTRRGNERRRRQMAMGYGLLVLCCCSLVSLATAVGGGWTSSVTKSSAAGFLGPFLPPSTAAALGPASSRSSASRRISMPRVHVSYTGTSAGSSPTPTTPVVVQFNHSSVAITQDSSSALSLPPSRAAARTRAIGKPANLPGLSKDDLILLRAGQRVQHQIRNGCMGSGYVVVDVLADSKKVWETLLNFERYPEMIPTIRKTRVTSRWRTITKGLFTLSKFRFRLSVVHKHVPEENRLDFYLDPDSTQYRSILEMAEGFWFIDDRPADRTEGWTRVYMSATVKVNNLVPMWLVEYAAERALKRATSWLKPYVEQNRGGGERGEK